MQLLNKQNNFYTNFMLKMLKILNHPVSYQKKFRTLVYFFVIRKLIIQSANHI
jgi:hypothetical protein